MNGAIRSGIGDARRSHPVPAFVATDRALACRTFWDTLTHPEPSLRRGGFAGIDCHRLQSALVGSNENNNPKPAEGVPETGGSTGA